MRQPLLLDACHRHADFSFILMSQDHSSRHYGPDNHHADDAVIAAASCNSAQ